MTDTHRISRCIVSFRYIGHLSGRHLKQEQYIKKRKESRAAYGGALSGAPMGGQGGGDDGVQPSSPPPMLKTDNKIKTEIKKYAADGQPEGGARRDFPVRHLPRDVRPAAPKWPHLAAACRWANMKERKKRECRVLQNITKFNKVSDLRVGSFICCRKQHGASFLCFRTYDR